MQRRRKNLCIWINRLCFCGQCRKVIAVVEDGLMSRLQSVPWTLFSFIWVPVSVFYTCHEQFWELVQNWTVKRLKLWSWKKFFCFVLFFCIQRNLTAQTSLQRMKETEFADCGNIIWLLMEISGRLVETWVEKHSHCRCV